MGVSGITKWMFILSIVAGLVVIAIMIMRIKKNKSQIKKIGIIIISLLLIVTMVANGAIWGFNNIINQYFSTVKVDDLAVDEATQASKDITTRLEEEGIVLLENKDAVLPLTDNKKINVFGISSISLIYGGNGSGASDESKNVTLQQGLSEAGFEVNDELTKFYEERLPEKESTNIFNLKGGDYNIYEPATSEYSTDLMNQAKSFSETALIVISRSGGEGGDLPFDMAEYAGGNAGKHYLELQDIEIAMVDMVKENFENVIVVINSSNAMELGFLEDEKIDGAIWIGGPGSTGCIAVGEILAGTVNPSGRLADIYAYDVTSAPAFYNAGNFYYTENGKKTANKYLEYAEGIYVGYRYYETRFVDNTTAMCDEAKYQEAVQYPFGYGLSYTTFEKELLSSSVENGVVSATVRVTNTGKMAGKEVVQVYYTAPYTIGGIEKSHVVLAAFDKTELLEAGASEEITLTFDVEDMASFDEKNAKAYVLDAGEYKIKLMDNSHEMIDSFTYTVKEQIVYDAETPRSSDAKAAKSIFDYASGEVAFVSRADWEGTLPKERVESKEAFGTVLYEMNKNNINELYCSNDPKLDDIVTGEDNGLALEDMIGLAYDDSKWDLLLNQLSLDEMGKLIGYAGFATVEVESIGKNATIDIDGPAGLNALTSDISGVQFPSEVVIASTYNLKLVEEMGKTYAQEANANGVNGLYAPAANIHRTPFSGRNFEYYSEDPLLSGKMGAAMVNGCNSCGIVTYVKHFALNDQETNRSGVATWSNEQAIREVYLKAFEPIVKEGKAKGIMTSYNRIGTVWAGGNYQLITNVLREEWDFRGMVITDYDNGGYMSTDQVMRAGGDAMLSTLGHVPSEVTTSSNYGKQQMRTACKHILYTVVNSRAYIEPVEMGFPYWLFVAGIIDAIILVGCFMWMMKITRKTIIRIE
ncbi:MAG: glycoside hydrolase family 3 C-terminal domain-containing protein [Agathobacter sp.]|nr:glycoside hydrolase family 3 C-terminal domain-containing protein [Agathobacter sp.]